MSNITLAGIIFVLVPVLYTIYKTITDDDWRDLVLSVIVPILMVVSLALGISLLIAGLSK